MLSVGGHLATEAPASRSCSLSRGMLADRLAERFTPQFEARGIAQRVARAVLEEMLHVMRPHPTLSEVLTEAALGVRGKPIHI
ncbi:MAG: hypothetical protein AUH38_00150 [Deltaproteobacteria bacterium 13_1_40CM_68_24]|nr:MAG: hypothetical protein AUH38_00150 [Deltaproteobacteria bacterium 13_1_40CM_68_24]